MAPKRSISVAGISLAVLISPSENIQQSQATDAVFSQISIYRLPRLELSHEVGAENDDPANETIQVRVNTCTYSSSLRMTGGLRICRYPWEYLRRR